MTRLTPRIRGPLLLVRADDNVVELEVWNERGVAEPTSVTLTIYDSDDTVIVNAASATIDSATSRASVEIDAASLPATLTLSDRWRGLWSATYGSTVYKFRQDAQLILSPYHGTVSPADLFTTCPKLDIEFSLDDQNDVTELSKLIQAAVEFVQAKLVSNGRRAWLIFDQWKLNEFVVLTVLGRIYRSHLADQESSNTAAITEMAEHYEKQADMAWATMNFKYDASETGKAGDATTLRGPSPIRIGITR